MSDRRSQRTYILRRDEASPTAALELVIQTSVFDAKEGQDVGISDVQGSFLHADNNEDMWMLLTRKLAELMVKVVLEIYSKHVTIGKDQKKLCCMLN